jgi:hypothetical protein
MRPPEELEAELVRTRRKLYRLSGVMTFVFIVCLIVVFAAVGGALVVVDKRAARTLPSDANDTHQTASAPQAPAPVAPPPAHADAAPATTVAAAPTSSPNNPPPQPTSTPPQVPAHANTAPPATIAAAPTNPPPEPAPPAQVRAPATAAAVSPAIKPTSPTPPATGLTGAGANTAQPAALPAPHQAPAPSTDVRRTARAHPRDDERSTVGVAPKDRTARSDDAREPPQAPTQVPAQVAVPSTDIKHTARTHPRHDERSTVGAAPNEPALRPDDPRDRRRARARAQPGEDEAVANGPRAQRVIVVGPPQEQARPADDQGAPPRQRDFFGDLFGGIFGNRDQ